MADYSFGFLYVVYTALLQFFIFQRSNVKAEKRRGLFVRFHGSELDVSRQLISQRCDWMLVHGQVTIIFVVSVCLFVRLFVCLCRVFLNRLRSDLDQTRTHVTCSGLVVSPKI